MVGPYHSKCYVDVTKVETKYIDKMKSRLLEVILSQIPKTTQRFILLEEPKK